MPPRSPRTTLSEIFGGEPPAALLPEHQLPVDELAEYLVDVGHTLSRYGCPSHRAESVMRLIGQLEGCECEVFAVPTGLWLSVRRGDAPPAVRLAREKAWRVDLDRLAVVDRIFNDVIERKLGLAAARAEIDALEKRRPAYPTWLGWAAAAGATAAAAVFFRGGWPEVLLAGLGGLLVHLARMLLRFRPEARLLENFIGGLIAGGIAWAATTVDATLSREVLILSVAIALVPGMALTTGLAELTNKSLVSGAARLMDAFMSFLSILFGIAVVIALEQVVGPLALHVPWAQLSQRPPFGPLAQLVALSASALAFSVIFSVPRRYLWAAMASGALGWMVTGMAAARTLPGSLAAFAAATSVTLWANLCARATQRPAQVFQLPGMVLLVPGSFGFLSLEAFLRGELLGGAAKGFEMFMIAGAIVTGTVLANVVLPARKVL